MTPDEAAEHASCVRLMRHQLAERFGVDIEFQCDYEECAIMTFPFHSAERSALQPADTKQHQARFGRLTHNVEQFNDKFRAGKRSVITVASTFEEFLPYVERKIDLLYMSPPWSWNGGDTVEIVERIADVVNEMETEVDLIVLMLKDDLCIRGKRAFESLHCVQSLPVVLKEKTCFYFHVFKRIEW
ncbi:MAG: hypothetical protein JZU63_06625 [Rhodoferax sp.]|nr:hypothetical protein [Rhodoferax sp.]